MKKEQNMARKRVFKSNMDAVTVLSIWDTGPGYKWKLHLPPLFFYFSCRGKTGRYATWEPFTPVFCIVLQFRVVKLWNSSSLILLTSPSWGQIIICRVSLNSFKPLRQNGNNNHNFIMDIIIYQYLSVCKDEIKRKGFKLFDEIWRSLKNWWGWELWD